MTKSWLLIDAKNAAYRAHYTTGGLSHGDVSTGVVFGILKEIKSLQERFGTNRVVFAFDWGAPLRKSIYKGYKANRETLKPKEIRIHKGVNQQVKLLRKDYLPSAGFRNLFRQRGMEADDIIASITKSWYGKPRDTCPKFIIVSSDHDFYQLLDWNVAVWHPSSKKLVTAESFTNEWKLSPIQWCQLKAIAGCTSDDVPGVKGVGEKTAALFLRGKLPETRKTHERIMKWIKWDPQSPTTTPFRRNLKLVRLPYEGCAVPKLRKDGDTRQGMRDLAERLGMRSMLGGDVHHIGRCQ